MIKIAFAGPKGCGKNTAALMMRKWLSTNYPSWSNKIGEVAFANPIKMICHDWLGMSEKHTDGFLKEVPCRFVVGTPEALRACLHQYANFSCSEVNPKYVDFIHGRITTQTFKHFLIDSGSETLVTSPRNFMQQFGTEVCRSLKDDIWVRCLGHQVENSESKAVLVTDLRFSNEYDYCKSTGFKVVHVESERAGERQNHQSEIPLEIEYGDFVIQNNGSFSDLQKSIKEVAREITGA